jgi:hypothetical protein
MARSPAIVCAPGAVVSAGNESTSVALFLPRKRRLRPRMVWSEVSNTVTWPRSLTVDWADARKRSSVRAVGRWRSMGFDEAPLTFAAFEGGAVAASRSGSKRIMFRGVAMNGAPGLTLMIREIARHIAHACAKPASSPDAAPARDS